MGSSSSKVAGKAASAAGRRQYPSTSSILNSAPSKASTTPKSNAPQPPTASTGSQVHPDPSTHPPTDTKSQHIDLDGRDPHFGAALRRLGPAKPAAEAKPDEGAFPTSSQPPLGQHGQNIFPGSSAASNPALMIVQARERIGKQWEQESESLGRSSFTGRTLLSAKDIKESIRLRDERGKGSAEVEKQMRLRPGVLDVLAAKGLIANA